VRLIQLKEAHTVLAGGTESMSQTPYVVRGARFGMKFNHQEIEDSLLAGLTDEYAKIPMAITAENLASDYKISREACDEYSLRSQATAKEATEKGHFKDEMISVPLKKGDPLNWDESIRMDSSLDKLSKLKPVFKKDGVVTAGNASGISDGAGAIIVTTEEKAKANKWPILAEWVSHHVVGCDPTRMGIGPVGAVRGALEKAGLGIKDMNLVEVNEAFAAQYLAVEKELGLDRNKTNTDGGAIALGHPLGASGTRILAHLIHRLRATSGGYGMGSACIGGGQGIAVLLKVAT